MSMGATILALVLSASPGAAQEGTPTVQAMQRRGWTRITAIAPPGEHLNPDGPSAFKGHLGTDLLHITTTGARLAQEGLRLAGEGPLQGTMQIPLCTDDGASCRVVTVAISGQPARRTASLALEGGAPPAALPPTHGQDVAAALAEAERTGRRVLIDFGAVWCPPCNLMSAQILSDPADQEALAPFVVVTVDVDDDASWALKDRYRIGGYPTVIIATPTGEELDRLVGYPGEAAMQAWLAATPAAPRALEAASPAQAAAGARRLAEQGQLEAARLWLAQAEDNTDARIARLILSPAGEDVRGLLAAQVPVLEWIGAAMPLVVEDDDLRGALRAAVAQALPQASGAEAADLLSVAAELSKDVGDQAALYGAAAQALGAVLTGDPAQDRGHWTFLAQLREQAGDGEGARVLLEDAVRRYPEEFTFHYALGGLLLRQGMADAAVVSAQAAVTAGYGDNRLRAVRLLAEALHADGQTAAALALLEETLASAARPPEGMQVRTPRYLKALEDARQEIAAGAADGP